MPKRLSKILMAEIHKVCSQKQSKRQDLTNEIPCSQPMFFSRPIKTKQASEGEFSIIDKLSLTTWDDRGSTQPRANPA